MQSRLRPRPGEKGGRRGGSPKWLLQEPGWHHSSPACVLVGHLLPDVSGLVVENGRVRGARLRAQCWPGPSPTWPRVAGRKVMAQCTTAGETHTAEGLGPRGPGASLPAHTFCPPAASSRALSARGPRRGPPQSFPMCFPN